MTSPSRSGYWGLLKNQWDESFCNTLIIFHTFHPYLPSLQWDGWWPGMLKQKAGSVVAAWLLAVTCLGHPQPVSLAHAMASISSQLPDLQDLSHLQDLSSSKELHLLLFKAPFFFPKPLLASTLYFLAHQDSLSPQPKQFPCISTMWEKSPNWWFCLTSLQ